MVRKLIMMLGAATMLLGVIDDASAAPLLGQATASHQNIGNTGQALLAGYEQEGLTLREDSDRHLLLIGADPAYLHPHDASSQTVNPYHLAVRDVLSAAASYAYLYFGLHPDAPSLSVQADIEQDGPVQASGSVEDQSQQPALSFTIPRPAFAIMPDTKPDAYSAQTISAILAQIDPAQTNIAPWLKASLQAQTATEQQTAH